MLYYVSERGSEGTIMNKLKSWPQIVGQPDKQTNNYTTKSAAKLRYKI